MLTRRNYVACWLCAGVAMACCLMAITGCGSKPDPANKPAQANPPQAQNAQGSSADSKKNETAKAPPAPIKFDVDAFMADPYKVPDGNNALLFHYIKQFSEIYTEGNTEAENNDRLCKTAVAIRSAVKKILANNPEPDERREAMVRKLESLYITAKRSPTPDERKAGVVELRQFAADLLKDADPILVRAGKGNLVKIDLDQVIASDGENSEELAKSLAGLLAAEGPGGGEYNLAMTVANSLEQLGKHTQALMAYDAIGKTFGGENIPPRLADLANKAADAAKLRLGLIGKPLELDGTFVDGTPLNWADYRGKIVLVDFWATWCPPCVGEIPNIKKNYERFHAKGFDVLGISLDDDRKSVVSFWKNNPIPWKSLIGQDKNHAGWDLPLVKKFGIIAIPVTILVDREGKVVTLAARGERLGKALEKLLESEGAPPAPKSPDEVAPSSDAAAPKSAEPNPPAPPAEPNAEKDTKNAKDEKKEKLESSSGNAPPAAKSEIQLTAGVVENKPSPSDKLPATTKDAADGSTESSAADESKLSGNPYLPGKKTSLADLVELLGQMREKAESIKKRAGFQEALVEIADRVLASESNDKAKTLAALAKLEALHALSLGNDKSADDKIRPMLDATKSSPDAALAREALFQSLEQRTMSSDELKQEQLVPLLGEIEKYFGKDPPITRQSRLASGVVHIINRIEDDKVAKKQMVRFAALFRKSKDQDLVRYGRKLAEASGEKEPEEKE